MTEAASKTGSRRERSRLERSRREWTGAEFADPQEWRIETDLRSFQLKAAEIRRELRHGRGFVVIRGLKLDEFAQECPRLGGIISQTLSGGLFYSVRDEGLRIETDYGKPGVRTSKTNARFQFHTDSPSRLAGHTPEFVALYVAQTAKSGGESALIDGHAVYEIIRRERPDLLARLSTPFLVDRHAECPPGEDSVIEVPVFGWDAGSRLVVRYLRLYIEKGHERRGAPLSASDVEALDFLDAVMNRPGLALTMPLERGDIQILNNTFLLHSRTEFQDYPEPERKRHYVRIWLNDV
jgi:alpha-ketoglutarate-dependent taurine dioxygenase